MRPRCARRKTLSTPCQLRLHTVARVQVPERCPRREGRRLHLAVLLPHGQRGPEAPLRRRCLLQGHSLLREAHAKPGPQHQRDLSNPGAYNETFFGNKKAFWFRGQVPDTGASGSSTLIIPTVWTLPSWRRFRLGSPPLRSGTNLTLCCCCLDGSCESDSDRKDCMRKRKRKPKRRRKLNERWDIIACQCAVLLRSRDRASCPLRCAELLRA